jgi:hypothetical protein
MNPVRRMRKMRKMRKTSKGVTCSMLAPTLVRVALKS